MQLSEYYQQQCHQGLLQPDPAQLAALEVLQTVSRHVQHHYKSSGWLRLRQPKPVKGVYLWGGVGIGKTLMMDCFYHCLTIPNKLRMHYHAFMRKVHQSLKSLQGHPNPLRLMARDFAKHYKVICLDEFIVTDIVDAMILAGLLQALTDAGICIVTTSNTEPDELYKNGLQRTSFLPAIALIHEHFNVVHLPSKQDYRMLQIKKSGLYFTPDDAAAEQHLQDSFTALTHGHELSTEPVKINDREIVCRVRTQDVIWFNFKTLCSIPRSQQDYLALAEQYKIIYLSHVPILSAKDKNTSLLFIRLIDVLYDAKKPLIVSAAKPANLLFEGLASMPEAARTLSRLEEMQSERYLSS